MSPVRWTAPADVQPRGGEERENRTRHGSWALEVPDGAYSSIPAWHSGAAWFDALMDALKTAAAERLRRLARVSAGTLLMVARADWLSADADTGRGVATAHETVALTLGMDKKTVHRARRLMEHLGFAVTVVKGRYLTTGERTAAYAVHGRRQVRAASVRTLTVPKPLIVENVHLPRRGEDLKDPLVKKNLLRRASAHTEAAPRPATTKRSQLRRSNTRATSPRPIVEQAFAAKLVARMPWLGRGRHIGAVCDMLRSAGIRADRWTVDSLLAAVEAYRLSTGIKVPDVTNQRNPIGYYLWLLRQAIDPEDETPTERRKRERDSRLKERATERADEAERVANIDRDEVARIIAESNRATAEHNRNGRHSASSSKSYPRDFGDAK